MQGQKGVKMQAARDGRGLGHVGIVGAIVVGMGQEEGKKQIDG